ncbi:AbrB/MazE/SpoVT family DNA-binding domain-containing protein [Mongoliimonas terrestris]|uniref:AbrB/MazE/SpoVT family DNA-binding domain-containing protein n=1 Tax=Mongoliimonas terrestris TaxID=1709001 RepID=UPI00094967AB|nr:AbrB/MazE/SpoVT family DNA-binding domain-containing protein [Mongoliimonas terrestris]
MHLGSSKVTAKGQFTLPAEVRSALGIRPGDTIEFFVHRSGEVFIHPRNRPASSIFGRAARYAAPVGEEERSRLIAEGVAGRPAADPSEGPE